ncbi:MAG: RNA pseudouridine synthase, partial [Planctomycetota bacterium]
MATQAPSQYESLESIARADCRENYLNAVHRLDVATSGIVLLASSKKAARLIGQQFSARTIEKTYQAMVSGDARQIERCWSDSIAKIQGHPRVRWHAQKQDASATEINKNAMGVDGFRVAETDVIDCSWHERSAISQLILKPRTGRMHQLRVGAAKRGFPILGDSTYGGCTYRTDEKPYNPHNLAITHGLADSPSTLSVPAMIALRAIQVRFRDPVTARQIQVDCEPLPWSEGIAEEV